MAGFSMCADRECPSAKLCKRSPASGTEESLVWQSWMGFKRGDAEACASVWPVDDDADKLLVSRGLLA